MLILCVALILLLYLDVSFLPSSPTMASAPVPEPVFSPPGGYYDRDIQVEIGCSQSGTETLFTLDGSVPTHTTGTLYAHPIWLDADAPAVVVIRARVVLPNGELGPVKSASYFVGVPATLPIISLVIDPADLWSDEQGIYANFRETGDAWERLADVTYVGEDLGLGFQVPAGVRIHGEWTRAYDKKSFRLYFRQEYGMSRLVYPLFGDSGIQSFKRLVLHNGGNDSPSPSTNWSLLRNQLVADLARETNVQAPRNQPVLVFLNGESWGIYQLREHIDRWFLADHYGTDSVDLLDSPDHALVGRIAEGDREHWDHVLQFVETHNLADPVNYQYLEEQVDLDNLVDYALIQIYSANADWPEHNVNQFRARRPGGRWQWILWDNDYSFGLHLAPEIGFEGELVDLNVVEKILNSISPETSGYDTLVLRRLFENQDFRARFLSRAADLLNTAFAPAHVLARLNVLAGEIAPDINYEVSRWGGEVNWEISVQAMREFVQIRPGVVRQHIVEAFGLPGTATLSFQPPSAGAGYIAINGELLPDLPWQGVYFQGMDVQIVAVPAPGYQFVAWDNPSVAQMPTITLTVNAALTLTPLFEKIARDVPRPGDVVFAKCYADDSDPQGDWFELLTRRGGLDLRGWRITDNDTKVATDEGSLILADHPALADVPGGTIIRIIATQTAANDLYFSKDDLNTWDRLIVLYVGNGHLDVETDPQFHLSDNDNLVLLAPGPTSAFNDDLGIDFAGSGVVTPASFGVLADGVTQSSCSVQTE
ncbi:MAG: CotH kinase family protein [Anaerolineae bacterium]|nr:CotH kinase family protein [Anaerolineae bacterium]